MIPESVISKRKEIAAAIEYGGRILKRHFSRSNKFSAVRLFVFAAGLEITIYTFTLSSLAGWTSLVLSLLVFGIVVHFHNKLLEGIRRLKCYIRIQEENLARMDIEWDKLPGFYSEESEGLDAFERDLDLYGRRSLHCLIDNTVSTEGSELLRQMLHGDFPGLDELKRRQQMIRELTMAKRMRNRFLLRAYLSSRKKLNCSATVEACNISNTFRLPAAVLTISILLSVTFIVLIILTSLGVYSGPVVLILVVNLFIYFFFAGKVNSSLEKLNDVEPFVSKLHTIIKVFPKANLEHGSILMDEFGEFFSAKSRLHTDLSMLKKISDAASYRENSIMRVLINLFVPYDFVLQRAFVRTADELRVNIEHWLRKLNELECLIALANYAELNPDYTFAEIEDDLLFTIRDTGHPLMKREERKLNDFSLTKDNEVVIITGSNMSGKSTFLRTIAVNLCLAYSGAPSACSKLRTGHYSLFTCIKVSDSVFDGISYFYAEVKRLKDLLNLLDSNSNTKVMFFIDEIFKGTNNKERLTGSMSFLKKIGGMNCTGFVTTHDLEIANLTDVLTTATNFHFKESISNNEMTFEYKIHPGPSPTTNALEIMRMNGLPVDS
jgi:ABC-type multidrug transport system fused ATPase/permease subunit